MRGRSARKKSSRRDTGWRARTRSGRVLSDQRPAISQSPSARAAAGNDQDCKRTIWISTQRTRRAQRRGGNSDEGDGDENAEGRRRHVLRRDGESGGRTEVGGG